MTLLRIRNLSVDFATSGGSFRAVDGVDQDVDTGEILSIVGESGSGKSVSMLAAMGLLPWTATVTADELSFDGRDLRNLSASARRKVIGREISMTFSRQSVFSRTIPRYHAPADQRLCADVPRYI